MTLPLGMVTAVYQDTGIPSYHGNPLIEALPPIPDRKQLIAGLSETVIPPFLTGFKSRP